MAKFYPFGGTTYTLKSSISSTQTTIQLSSLREPVTGTPITMALLNTDIAFGTIQPKTASSEFISFTGITQNDDGSATLTGVVRGLAKKFPFTTDSAYKLPHTGQSIFIFSDVPQLFQEYVSIVNDQTVDGVKTFSSFPEKSGLLTPTDDEQFATKKYVDDVATGGVGVNRIVISGTVGENVSAGQFVYYKTADGLWYLTDADTASTVNGVIFGVIVTTATSGNQTDIFIWGRVTGLSGLVAGTTYYLSNTAGAISSTPGTIARAIGKAITTTELILDPYFTYIPTASEKDALVGVSGTPSSTNKYETENDTSNAATITGTTISFTASSKTIADSGNGFVTANFRAGDSVIVTGSASNNGTYTIVSVAAGAIVVAESLTDESAGPSVSLNTVVINKLIRANSSGALPSTVISNSGLSTLAVLGNKLALSTTPVTVASTLTETNIISFTVPAGTLSTGNGIAGFANVNLGVDANNSSALILRLKFGATTIATLNIASTTAVGNTGTLTGQIKFNIFAAGTTNSQKGNIFLTVGQSTFVISTVAELGLNAMADGTAAEDSTANKTLTITAQFANNTANNNITMQNYVVEKIS